MSNLKQIETLTNALYELICMESAQQGSVAETIHAPLVNYLHQRGYAAVVFTPEQLRGVDAGELEEALAEPCAKILNDLRLDLNGPDEVACANCDWTGQEDECVIPKRLWERMAPGDTYPAGECPECGALAFLIEESESV